MKPPRRLKSCQARRRQEKSRQHALDEKNEQNHEQWGEIDSAGPPRGQDPAKGAENRFRRAIEKANDRVARVRADPRDQSGEDHEPLHDRQSQKEKVGESSSGRSAEIQAGSREPNKTVPRRTSVEPSSTATSKSWLIPIETSGNARPNRSCSRSRTSTKR